MPASSFQTRLGTNYYHDYLFLLQLFALFSPLTVYLTHSWNATAANMKENKATIKKSCAIVYTDTF